VRWGAGMLKRPAASSPQTAAPPTRPQELRLRPRASQTSGVVWTPFDPRTVDGVIGEEA